MNIKPVAVSLCVILGACNSGGGGHSSAVGAPGKSAYEIWLEQGNVGTEQDFLDSLVSGGDNKKPDDSENKPGQEETTGNGDVPWNTNGDWGRDSMANTNSLTAKDYLKHLADLEHYTLQGEIDSQDIEWGKHGSYNQYSATYENAANGEIMTYIYKEKELTLGNYGVKYSFWRTSLGNMWLEGYFHNRGGKNVNVYTPQINTKFSGSTMAYLVYTNKVAPTFIQGDAFFVYDPKNPELELDFDNYYSFKFVRKNDGHYYVDVSGKNSTGSSKFDLNTGHFTSNSISLETGYLKQEETEEALGRYTAMFGQYEGFKTYEVGGVNEVTMYGAFGGTKQ